MEQVTVTLRVAVIDSYEAEIIGPLLADRCADLARPGVIAAAAEFETKTIRVPRASEDPVAYATAYVKAGIR